MRGYMTVVIGTFAVGLLIAADPKDDAEKELKKLEGTYVMVSGQSKADKLPDEVVNAITLNIKGDKHTIKLADGTINGTHKLAPTKNPKEIDVVDTEGPYKEETLLGIYKFEKGELTVCFAPPGKDRPKEFITTSGTGEILHVWRKKE